jgi:hypothetical protein
VIRTVLLIALTAAVPAVPEANLKPQPAPPPKPGGQDRVLQPIPFQVVADACLSYASQHPNPHRIRFIEFGHVISQKKVDAVLAILNDHVNKLSRGPLIVRAHRVMDRVYAVDTNFYVWDPQVYENLKNVNHYWNWPVTIELIPAPPPVPKKVKKTRQVIKTDQFNRQYYANEEYEEEETPPKSPGPEPPKKEWVPGRWVDQAKIAKLVELTQSKTPIIRADEFIFNTAAQQGRKGYGYADFLGIKDIKDFEKINALDRKLAIESYREFAAMIPVSGVTLPDVHRQIFGFVTIAGGVLETRDARTGIGAANCTSNLFEDYKPNALELIGTLFNNQPVAGLFDFPAGTLQDVAPPDIASDSGSANQDHQVHLGYSCWACHERSGLKAYKDWARATYNAKTGLSFANLLKGDDSFRLRAENAYLGPGLEALFVRMEANFAMASVQACGLKGAPLAAAWREVWQDFHPVFASIIAGTPLPRKVVGERFPVGTSMLDSVKQ